MMNEYTLDTKARWTDTPQAKDLKHLALHVAKKCGKIAAILEDAEHAPVPAERWDALKAKDVPDLVILGAMFADVLGIDLNVRVAERGNELARREVKA